MQGVNLLKSICSRPLCRLFAFNIHKQIKMDILKQLYRSCSQSGHEAKISSLIQRLCSERGYEIKTDAAGNVYITKGCSETYPCVVAHMDEVHQPTKRRVIIDGDMIWAIDMQGNRTGCGADDKNGIWIALRALERLDVLKVAFFVGEEIGCVGSSKADMSFFENCRFVLQYDRRNANDFITSIGYTDLCNDRFIRDVDRVCGYLINFHQCSGLMTDVMELKGRGLKICCANFSCGYYNPHTDNEYTVISELNNALDCCVTICSTMVDTYEHINTNWYDDWGWGYEDTKASTVDEFEVLDAMYEAFEAGCTTFEEYVIYITKEYPSTAITGEVVNKMLQENI